MAAARAAASGAVFVADVAGEPGGGESEPCGNPACTLDGGAIIPFSGAIPTGSGGRVQSRALVSVTASVDTLFPHCTDPGHQGPWRAQWVEQPRAGGHNTKLADFGALASGATGTSRLRSISNPGNDVPDLLWTGRNVQCAQFHIVGRPASDHLLKGRVLASCTTGCASRHPGLAGVKVDVRGDRSLGTRTDGDGYYAAVLPRGSYTVAPRGIVSEPPSRRVALSRDISGLDFDDTAAGRVTLGSLGSFDIVTVSLAGSGSSAKTIIVTKLVDESSAAIQQAVAQGITFPTGIVVAFKPGTHQPSLTDTLTDVTISSAVIGRGDGATEALNLVPRSQSIHRP
jgi:hypothetical protein